MPSRLAVGVVVGVAVATAAHTATAGPLGWDAPASCPSAADERARVEHRLGAPLDDAALPGVAVAIAHDGARFVATITTSDDDDRVLTADRCSELADAVAVVVARIAEAGHAARSLHVDPAPAMEALAFAGPAALTTPQITAAAPVLAPPSAVAAAPRAPSEWQLGGRLATFSDVGVLPGTSVGGEVDAFAHARHFLAELGVAHWLTESAVADHGVGLTVATERIGWRLERIPVRGWLVGEAGPMSGVSSGFMKGSGTVLWRAAGAGVAATWAITHSVAVVVGGEALIGEGHVDFQYGGGSALYQSQAVSFRASLGLELGW